MPLGTGACRHNYAPLQKAKIDRSISKTLQNETYFTTDVS